MDAEPFDPVSDPLVSVVISNYNTGRYLPETLESALAQTHRRIEIIVVDDGSTDDTAIRVEPYLDRIRFFQQPHGGLAAARNAGLAVANGDYIALLDADDLWLPEKLAVQLEIARRKPESGLIACDGREFGSASNRASLLSGSAAAALRSSRSGEVTTQCHREFFHHVGIRCPAQTLIPRRVIQQIGPFGDFDAQDYEYYLRLSARFPVTFHSHSLVRWRDREDSMSGPRARRDLTWARQRLVVLRSYALRCEPQDRATVERQLVRTHAKAAFHCAELFDRRRAFRAMQILLRRHPWPPTALPFLIASTAPGLARAAHRLWTRHAQ
jgi:glycosyltransferase involved in cell wall biosynthesis